MRITSIALCISLSIASVSPALAKGDEQEMVVGGWKREYRVHLPANYDPSRRYPAVIVLHGAGANFKMIETVSHMSELADREQFVAIYPNGVGKINGWNGGMCCGVAAKKNVDDAGFLDQLITTVESNYSIDPARVYITGFSNGGMLAYAAAAKLQDKVAALGIIEGSMSGKEARPTKKMPVVIFHGTDDKRVAYTGGLGKFAKFGLKVNDKPVPWAVEWWKQANGAKPAPIETQQAGVIKDEYVNEQGKPVVVLYTIIGGGHAWAGGEKSAPWGVKPVKTIDATKEIWEFFRQHEREQTQTAGVEQPVQ